jgi:neopullulanase
MDFSAGLESEVARYRPEHTSAQYNVIGSHDTERFLTLAEGRVERLKLAMFFLMTYVGAPSIYYGDEIGLVGGKDPLNRACFPWNRDVWNEELREWVRNCISLRQSFASLRRGTLVMLHARDSSRTVAFARRHGRETMLVVLNASDNDASIDMLLSSLNIEDEMLLHDQLSTRSYTVQNQSVRSVKVPANGAALLMLSRR